MPITSIRSHCIAAFGYDNIYVCLTEHIQQIYSGLSQYFHKRLRKTEYQNIQYMSVCSCALKNLCPQRKHTSQEKKRLFMRKMNYNNNIITLSPAFKFPYFPYFLWWFGQTLFSCRSYIFPNAWGSIIALCLFTLIFSHALKLSTANRSGWCLTHIILIKNLFSEEYSRLQALGGDRLMTVTSIISSQALYLQYMDEDDRQGQWTIQILEMWIRTMITTLLLPINHTLSRTGDWRFLTMYGSNRKNCF